MAEPARSPVPRHGGPASAAGFGDRLASCVAERESQIVLGLDPDPMTLWPGTHAPAGYSPAQRAAASVSIHCRALIDAAGPACVAVKLQLARFEVLGALGWTALATVAAHASAAGLLVIADGKRGDIDVSARAYAQALTGALDTPFGSVRGLDADAVTVNPLMGADAIEPFVSTARESGVPGGHTSGVLALVRTSNPGAADIEDLELARGGRVWERIAALVDELGSEGVGESGLSDVGAVVGATAPQHLARARELMPHAVFLLPGVGAQGGVVEDLAPAFAPGRAGGLIAASRSIANAHLAAGGSDPAGAARAEAERLRELAWRFT
ncbi:MAG TPA: orotidine-5'-phosphate decarboxylase [Solirubrobacteraceae bacterium]|nr:orotidine-5'-phosphate decarboxylase [Solirubrobacteraceae bacterium]